MGYPPSDLGNGHFLNVRPHELFIYLRGFPNDVTLLNGVLFDVVCCGRADNLDDVIGVGRVCFGPHMGRVILVWLRIVSLLNGRLYCIKWKQLGRNIHRSVFKKKLDIFRKL